MYLFFIMHLSENKRLKPLCGIKCRKLLWNKSVCLCVIYEIIWIMINQTSSTRLSMRCCEIKYWKSWNFVGEKYMKNLDSGFIPGNYCVENLLHFIQFNVSRIELTYPVHQGSFQFFLVNIWLFYYYKNIIYILNYFNLCSVQQFFIIFFSWRLILKGYTWRSGWSWKKLK